MSLLEHVKMPNNHHGGERGAAGDHHSFNNYLSKLQTLCNSGGPGMDESYHPRAGIFDAVKSELQDFTILPTPV